MLYTGKQYIAIDNSYEQNLTNPKATRPYLAGTADSDPILTTIVSEPFCMNVTGHYTVISTMKIW